MSEEQPRTISKLTERLVDSALVIGCVVAVAFGLGYYAEITEARSNMMPMELQYERSVRVTIMQGTLVLFAVLGMAFATYCVLLWVKHLYKQVAPGWYLWSYENFKIGYARSTRVYQCAAIFAIAAVFLFLADCFISFYQRNYPELWRNPSITKIELKEGRVLTFDNATYQSHRDGVIVIKDLDREKLVVVNAKEMVFCELDSRRKVYEKQVISDEEKLFEE
ncbi:hypothetical protein Pan97_17020 [Bremerella volcania]|uniref:Uncharacterized protein n=1 Tax=Bremerella volcania TaxID=2527984 RepID=A0A518C640_9BACT|nr:hypothetical protein [Bremerella volcania]QDU74689.1 hypothetical protein Pan97_17020 [Bremerella volcania]